MKKVLIIEDNKDLLESTAEILELSNYQVFTAADGIAGIEMALANKPDLILCDVMMPELDGYGVLHIVQRNPVLQDTPFIFLSARTDMADFRKGMALGADDYIAKPFDPTDLLNAIEGRLKKAEISRKHFSEDLLSAGSTSLFSGKNTLSNFIEGRQIEKFRKKQRIFSEGNHPIKLYYVEKGKVKIYKLNEDGKELIIKIINEGEFFGYLAMLENSRYKISADALEDSEIATIPRKEFEDLMKSNPELVKTFINLLANDVTEREEQLLHIAYNSLRKKVAEALLSVCRKFKSPQGKCIINLSRENLAAVAGTATESLIRTLTDFKDEKLIEIRDTKVEILDMERLKKLVN